MNTIDALIVELASNRQKPVLVKVSPTASKPYFVDGGRTPATAAEIIQASIKARIVIRFD